MATMMLPQWGMRHGGYLVRYESQSYVKEHTCRKGHIVEFNGRLLECVGHTDTFMHQPIFNDVTTEIQNSSEVTTLYELNMDKLILGASAVQL